MVEKKMKDREVVVRKVIQINGSLYVCIPSKFVIRQGIQAGDDMVMMPGADHLKMVPMEKK